MNRSSKIKSLLGLVVALTAASATVVARPAKTGEAKFTKVEGTVTLDNKPVVVGQIATPPSMIATGQKSLAKLFLAKNGPDLLVDENSKLAVDELTYDDSGSETVISTKLGVKGGSVSGRVKQTSAQSVYTVASPTTTAAIRGTIFTATLSGVVYIFDGSADVIWTDPSTGRPANFNVSAGQMFDPSIPGVVEIPPGTKSPFATSDTVYDTDLPVPTGPITIVSPISGSKK